jgi:hypothetical protein
MEAGMRLWIVALVFGLLSGGTAVAGNAAENVSAGAPAWSPAVIQELERSLAAAHGEEQRPRIRRGLRQVADFWRPEDGGEAQFREFVATHYAADAAALDAMFDRYQYLLEKLDGHMNKLVLELRRHSDLDLGPILPFDALFASFDPSAHLDEDLFQSKLALVALLNFPLTTLEQRLLAGEHWSRRQWAEARLAQRFSRRLPAEVNQAIARAGAEGEQYIAEYNIWMHHLVDEQGERMFPAGMRLLSHWNLRDEIGASYALEDTGLAQARQRMIQRVMEHIVAQTIPAAVVNNPHLDWNPYTNEVAKAAVTDTEQALPAELKADTAREPDERYRVLLGTWRAARMADPYSPTAPTLIARRFDENREIPELRVDAMLRQVLASPLVPRVASLIEQRLGRPLEPFDIWYTGFRPRGSHTAAELDAAVARRYPDAAAFEAALPNLLQQLGFSRQTAARLAANVVVEPARGSGHAWGAAMRSERTHLRTRIGAGGMDYKSYNIAVHELGHNVEQTFSLHDMDYTLLQGVPNTAFTEAIAFVFQARDLELLGFAQPDPSVAALRTLHDFWGTVEIAAVALVDMGVWHWMYDHPQATPAELREATLAISMDVWNRYFAPVFGARDSVLLGIYSHMIDSFLYLPDYPVGRLIAHQIEERIRSSGQVAAEIERMARIGNISPDLWMRQATGAPVGAEALLAAAERALREIE